MQVHTDCAISVSLQHEDPLRLDDGDRGLFHLPMLPYDTRRIFISTIPLTNASRQLSSHSRHSI
ncbi:hypothetical protein I7I53_06389 [Histoplasma capsulatum var. duboisii H88]|uniref:Uncharacterized protein n=1 Tax=Ajellomyces capsulatus (strain H88) TaxID=544711 RepID=A0A8A1LB16_AJEC8|nr:hypothetical protein I7I53_06389 [Histoplasma capsulatum var. duboisii H88]